MLEDALAEWVRATCHATRVEVHDVGLGQQALPAGGTPSFSGDPCRAHPILRLTWRTPDDTDALTIRPSIDVWMSALVAAKDVAVGEPVDAVPGEVLVAALAGGAVPAGAWIARSALPVGAPLTRVSVAPRPDALAGARVVLAVKSGALTVRTDATLLRAAQVGDEVRVLVDATHKVVSGRLVDTNTVEL